MLEIMALYPRYKYEMDESYEHEDKELREKNFGYYVILKCRYGDISQRTDTRLHIITGKEKRVINKFLSINDSKLEANGDEETIISFPVIAFKLAKKIAKPLLNDTEKTKIAQRLHKSKQPTQE